MASENKKRKLANAYMVWSGLKDKSLRCKRFQFYNASYRKWLKQNISKELEQT